jgi:hypothetical protein
MSEHEFRLKSGCTVKWHHIAGAVEEIRRQNLQGVAPVECDKCGYWHIRVVVPRRAAA